MFWLFSVCMSECVLMFPFLCFTGLPKDYFSTLVVWKFSKVETQLRSSWHWSSRWEVWKLDLLWTLTMHFGKTLHFGFVLNFKNVSFFCFFTFKNFLVLWTRLSFNLPKLSTNSSSWSVKLLRNSRPVECWLKTRTYFLFASEEERIILVM